MSVLDASLYAEALTAATPLGESARRRLRGSGRWHAPAILPAEVASAIRGLVLGGQLTVARAGQARARLRRSRITLHAFMPFEERVWELRTNLTVYDAWYAALAERLGVPLVTTDARVAAAPGLQCPVDLVSP